MHVMRRPADPARPGRTRREFLKTLALGGAASLAACAGIAAPSLRRGGPRAGRVDHVIVLMQENRSFDHYFGWRTGTSRRRYRDDEGREIETHALAENFRGCGFADPDHSWEGGRRQLARGFRAGAWDDFGLGYYTEREVPFYAALAERFTLCDNYFASVLGPTYPNRSYMHSAQCGGLKDNSTPADLGFREGFPWPTIWDRLEERSISWAYYFVDLPMIAFWGPRFAKGTRSIFDFYQDAATGRLPSVCFVDPGFTSPLHTDEHPCGDIRVGQAFVREAVAALLRSPLWERLAAFVTYDEWGGFFDGVTPPRVADDRSSDRLDDDFGQLGFRVPCTVVSPFSAGGRLASERAPAGRVYEHTSILKFIERRFGLEPLTRRDAHAADIGELLRLDARRTDRDEILASLPVPAIDSARCDADPPARVAPVASDFEQLRDRGFFEHMGYRPRQPKLSQILAA